MKNYRVIILLTVFVMICSIIWFMNNQKVETLATETRKFDVLGTWESSKLISEIENKYLLWNKDNQRELLEQPFINWNVKLVKSVPEILEPGTMIYFPSTFKVEYPMYYKSGKHNVVSPETPQEQEYPESTSPSISNLIKYYYPRPNSMIIAESNLEWVSKDSTQQVVVIGELLKSRE